MKINERDLNRYFDIKEGQKENHYSATRADGLTLEFSVEQDTQSVSIRVTDKDQETVSLLQMSDCAEIRVLDPNNKKMEVMQKNGKGRCVVSLLDSHVFKYEDKPKPVKLSVDLSWID